MKRYILILAVGWFLLRSQRKAAADQAVAELEKDMFQPGWGGGGDTALDGSILDPGSDEAFLYASSEPSDPSRPWIIG